MAVVFINNLNCICAHLPTNQTVCIVHVNLRGIDTHAEVSAISFKGENFYDFLFGFLYNESFGEIGSTLKGRNFLLKNMFLHFGVGHSLEQTISGKVAALVSASYAVKSFGH